MKKRPVLPIPVARALRKLGSDINEARRRRRITMQLLSERTNLARATISKIEKGDPSCSLGGYALVLFVLGMIDRLADLADFTHDHTGHMLEQADLPQRVRSKKKH